MVQNNGASAVRKPWSWAALVLAGGLLAACDKAPAPATPVAAPEVPAATSEAAPAAAPAPSSLEGLRAQVGHYRSDGVDFLRQGPLAERLQALLGADYEVVLTNLDTSGPLEQEGELLYISGNKPHEGGEEQAAVVIDLAQNALRVWLLHAGQMQDKQDPAATVAWPSSVQAQLDNHKDMQPK